jgi:hypothetical protein
MAVQYDILQHFGDEMIDATLSSGEAGSYDDEGRWTPVIGAGTPVQIIAPQPVSGKDLQLLPQGEHVQHFQVSWVQETNVKTREYLEDADRININGEVFKIHRTNDRRTLGNFIKFFIREIRDDN